MKHKLSVFDRRMEMMTFIINKRTTSFKELSTKFSVCVDTVHRDIDAISRYAPIITKQGMYGGIFLSEQCQNSFLICSSKIEINLLEELKSLISDEEKIEILNNIIYRYSMI